MYVSECNMWLDTDFKYQSICSIVQTSYAEILTLLMHNTITVISALQAATLIEAYFK